MKPLPGPDRDEETRNRATARVMVVLGTGMVAIGTAIVIISVTFIVRRVIVERRSG